MKLRDEIDCEAVYCVTDRFAEWSVTVIRDMIIPNCIWVAGRTAAAVRKAAVACLWALIRTHILTRDQVLH